MKILLISNDKNFADKLIEKLVFLRRDDEIEVSDYENALRALNCAQIILVHENSDNTLDLITELRKNPDLCIILLANSYDSELILSCADAGIDDFILSSAEDFELVIRIVNNIKQFSVKLAARRNVNLLEQMNVIEDGIYTYESCKQVMENVSSGIFMVLSPADSAKTYFSYDVFAKTVKSCVRPADLVFKGRGVNFYLFLPKTDFNGALAVLNKIKQNIDFDICAGISDISNKSFDEFEQDAVKALGEAIATQAEYVFAENKSETLDEWLSDAEEKNYKLFRQIFNKKLEKVIAPVFYRLQKSYEEKLFETEIEQFTNNEQCLFRLKNKNGESSLKIVYPGFAKIVIYINHDGLDSPENREIHLSLSKITQKELVNIIENFIIEFKEIKC